MDCIHCLREMMMKTSERLEAVSDKLESQTTRLLLLSAMTNVLEKNSDNEAVNRRIKLLEKLAKDVSEQIDLLVIGINA